MMVTRLLAACGGFGLAVYLAFAPMSPAGAYESTSGEALHQACGGAAPHALCPRKAWVFLQKK